MSKKEEYFAGDRVVVPCQEGFRWWGRKVERSWSCGGVEWQGVRDG